MLVPSFIDIHMHGCGGHDAGSAEYDGITEMCRLLARHGTGGFLPTLPAVSPDVSLRALSLFDRKMKEQAALIDKMADAKNTCFSIDETLVLGVHLEGPFMLPAYKGALDQSVFMDATVENWKRLTGEFEHVVRRITIDPLCPGAMDLIPYLANKGISVSCGHTAADSDTISEAFRRGATSVTHIFNAMPSIHHRAPGPAAAAMADDNAFAELISDFLHVNKVVCKMVIKSKSPDKVAVITDSCEAAGMPDGNYKLCGRDIKVINGEARLEDGRLASSTVFMDKERLNLLSLGFGERDISKLTHYTPLSCISLSHELEAVINKIYAVIEAEGNASGLYFKN